MNLTAQWSAATRSATCARTAPIALARILCLCLAPLIMSFPASSLSAQRYLTELVGTTRIIDGTSNAIPALPSLLNFEVLENRQVDGTFSFVNPANLRSSNLLATGTLAASGNCNVQLQSIAVTGGLKLAESEFDAASFALLGKVTITEAATGGTLPRGKHVGNLGVLRPIDGALIISTRDKSVRMAGAFAVVNHEELVFSGLDTNFTATGRLGRSDDPAGFDVTLSSSDRWTYLVGVNADGFLVARGAAELDNNGVVTAFRGEFQLLDSSSRVLDFGSIDVRE